MRKYLRNVIRAQAEKEGVKPSKAVKNIWYKVQIKKYKKPNTIMIHKAKGTHTKNKWPQRIESVLYNK